MEQHHEIFHASPSKNQEEKFATVKLPGSPEVIIIPHGSLGYGRYFDVESSSSFQFDHPTPRGCATVAQGGLALASLSLPHPSWGALPGGMTWKLPIRDNAGPSVVSTRATAFVIL